MAVSAASAMNVTGSDTDAASYVTASWSPTTGKLYVVACCHIDLVDGNTTAASISGNNITWTSIQSVAPNGTHKLRAWSGYADGTQTTGAITFSSLVSSGTAQGAIWGIVELSNTTASGTVVQSAQHQTTSDTTTATLAAFSSASNATGAWVSAYDLLGTDPTITAGTGFSIVSGLDAAQTIDIQSVHLAFQFRADNDTSVDATTIAANDQMMNIAFEIAAGAGPATRPRDRQVAAIRRTSYW